MRTRLQPQRAAFQSGSDAFSREGRDSELSRRVTAAMLFPREVLPGSWVLLLAATFTLVAVRALELGGL